LDGILRESWHTFYRCDRSMNAPENSKLQIFAEYIGPIFSLDDELTSRAQNLIFARNGTGKSFLSRAFRYLDLHGQEKETGKAAFYLVSEEAPDGKGRLKLKRGANVLGELTLSQADNPEFDTGDTIFHVFSDDFVQDELRENQYDLDGEIENEIAVGRENIELRDAQSQLDKLVRTAAEIRSSLSESFSSKRESDLKGKADINAQLREYRALGLDAVLAMPTVRPAATSSALQGIIADLDRLKSMPSDFDYPESVEPPNTEGVDLDLVGELLQRRTSPSTVAEQIKTRIEAHNEFYKTGVQLVKNNHLTHCPFCQQDIQKLEPNQIIDEYIAYFAQEEEKHKGALRQCWKTLNEKREALNVIENRIGRQKASFDSLKVYLPSFASIEISQCADELDRLRYIFSSVLECISEKGKNLAIERTLEVDNFNQALATLTETLAANRAKCEALSKAIGKADDERRSLQRNACAAFVREFQFDHWDAIEELNSIEQQVRRQEAAVRTLERSGPTTSARDRVADTFELLLNTFFGDKYVFNRTDFTLKRGSYTMTRGTHRTMSDGEKSAMAFCYFVATIHRRMTANDDYGKLFLVFDDPVTSMSYDFVFTIAETLKHLSISREGEISINPSVIDGNRHVRPNLLILTHSSYFFNISKTNRVVAENAAFSLHKSGDVHRLSRMDKYVAPFQQQLREVFDVANGTDPSHTTGASVRAVLEAVGRFCRPDKAENLTKFVVYLAGISDLNIKSVMINNLSHGTFFDETPSPEDLRMACEETIRVVEMFAPGQVELVRGG